MTAWHGGAAGISQAIHGRQAMDISPVKGWLEELLWDNAAGFMVWWVVKMISVIAGIVFALARPQFYHPAIGISLMSVAVFSGMFAMLKSIALYRETKRMRVQLYLATGIKP